MGRLGKQNVLDGWGHKSMANPSCEGKHRLHQRKTGWFGEEKVCHVFSCCLYCNHYPNLKRSQ